MWSRLKPGYRQTYGSLRTGSQPSDGMLYGLKTQKWLQKLIADLHSIFFLSLHANLNIFRYTSV